MPTVSEILSTGFGVDPFRDMESDMFLDCVIDEKFYYNGFVKCVLGKLFDGVEDNAR